MEINVVFEGGGVTGIALAGAAAGALEAGYTFHRTVGTLAGAWFTMETATSISTSRVRTLWPRP